MQRFIKSTATISAALVISCVSFISPKPASAEPQRFSKSYIGAGVGFNESDVAPSVTGRVSFGDIPVSLRAKMILHTAYLYRR
jgi:hypothetical protein